MSQLLPDRERFRFGELARAIGKDVSTIFRWTLRGVRGHVLKSYVVGGQRYVEREDFLAFIGAINGSRTPAATGGKADREAELRRVDEALDRAGI
jgi:Protein of unknown function (DUF1580)